MDLEALYESLESANREEQCNAYFGLVTAGHETVLDDLASEFFHQGSTNAEALDLFIRMVSAFANLPEGEVGLRIRANLSDILGGFALGVRRQDQSVAEDDSFLEAVEVLRFESFRAVSFAANAESEFLTGLALSGLAGSWGFSRISEALGHIEWGEQDTE